MLNKQNLHAGKKWFFLSIYLIFVSRLAFWPIYLNMEYALNMQHIGYNPIDSVQSFLLWFVFLILVSIGLYRTGYQIFKLMIVVGTYVSASSILRAARHIPMSIDKMYLILVWCLGLFFASTLFFNNNIKYFLKHARTAESQWIKISPWYTIALIIITLLFIYWYAEIVVQIQEAMA